MSDDNNRHGPLGSLGVPTIVNVDVLRALPYGEF